MPVTREQAEQIAAILESLAFYNDKGAMWSGHSPEQVARERESARAEIEAVLGGAPPDVPEFLMRALESGKAFADWSGRYAEFAAAWAGSLT